MIGFLRISDTHARDNIAGIIRTLHAKYPDDYVVHSGDMTDQATDGQYNKMYGAMTPLAVAERLLCLPGNHDCFQGQTGLNLLFWRRNGVNDFDVTFDTAFYGLNQPMLDVFEEEKTVVIRLDSNCENLKWSLACGRVGFYQRYLVGKLLDQYKGYTRIVALHHHPFDRGLGRFLIDSEEFMNVVRGRCEVLCFGHKHKHEGFGHEELVYHIPYILASGALYEDTVIWRVTIDGGSVAVQEVPVA